MSENQVFSTYQYLYSIKHISSFWPNFGMHYNTTAWAITAQFFHAQRFLQLKQNTQKVKDTHHITSKVA